MPRGPKGNGQTRRVSSTNSPRAGPLLVTSMRRRDHARRVFLAVSWVTDLGCHRVKKGSADVATGTAWPLGRRSPVWAKDRRKAMIEQIHFFQTSPLGKAEVTEVRSCDTFPLVAP